MFCLSHARVRLPSGGAPVWNSPYLSQLVRTHGTRRLTFYAWRDIERIRDPQTRGRLMGDYANASLTRQRPDLFATRRRRQNAAGNNCRRSRGKDRKKQKAAENLSMATAEEEAGCVTVQ